MDKLRKFRGKLSQREMAKEIGVSHSYYSKVEKGFQNPSYRFLWKFKHRFPEVDLDEMFFSK